MKRVIVALKNQNGDYKIPKFCECIIDYFNKDALNVQVNCELNDDVLVLSENPDGIMLQHSVECPIKALWEENQIDNVPLEKQEQFINVAVSMMIESSDHHILLTRRPAHMRTSPKIWVPPGGHLELGETLLECGIREVKEETGLDISNSKTNFLGFWESIYPLVLGFGPPSNHVLIIYFHAIVNETHKELQEKMKPDPEEVAAFCWLSPKTVTNLFTPNRIQLKQKQYTLVNGEIIEEVLDSTGMFNKYLWTKGQIYSGVQFALKSWINSYRNRQNLNSKI